MTSISMETRGLLCMATASLHQFHDHPKIKHPIDVCTKLDLGFGGGRIVNSIRKQSGNCAFKLGKSSSSLFQSEQKSRTGKLALRCQAMKQTQMENEAQTETLDKTVYQGVYGPWTIDPSDIREVLLYRSGLVTAAGSFVVAGSTAFLPKEFFLSQILEQNLDLLFVFGAAGLGLSLYLIHIYVTEIKRTLQALWALGVVGSLATYTSLARPAHEGLVQYVVDNPTAVWFVGPLFAALTGLVFKEGLCYGKLEAGLLAFLTPTILLGHMTGLMDDGVKLSLLGLWMALIMIFAGRKFTQPVKDDIGDKSVFIFNALAEDEKAALLAKLERQ